MSTPESSPISPSKNPSTNTATVGTLDEESGSSIEALNWSEFDEEEMASAMANYQEEVKIKERELVNANNSDDDGTEKNPSEPASLSTSLLRSMNSQSSGEDPKSVIQNWATDVLEATRGDADEVDGQAEGILGKRKSVSEPEVHLRKRDKLTPMCTSTFSGTDSNIDPLSNAPVLDDGPIWAKGSKSYRFEENRRMNQKLTFGVLISVVLAVGLGLGNLVAYNECEAEFKMANGVGSSSDGDDFESSKKMSIQMQNRMKMDSPIPSIQISAFKAKSQESTPTPTPVSTTTNEAFDRSEFEERYAAQTETLANIIKSLDQLAIKIDQFENTTRQLDGILTLKQEIAKLAKHFQNSKAMKKLKSGPDNLPIDMVNSELNDDLIQAVTAASDGTKEPPPKSESGTQEPKRSSLGNEERAILKKALDILLSTPELKELGWKEIKKRIMKTKKSQNRNDPRNFEDLENEDKLNRQNTGDGQKESIEMKLVWDDNMEFPVTKPKKQKKREKLDKGKKKYDNVSFDDISIEKSYTKKSKDRDRKRRNEDFGNGQWNEKNLNENWQTDRAKVRESQRRNVENKENLSKKTKNWQIERDRVREKFRGDN